jgi:hypothetical protein
LIGLRIVASLSQMSSDKEEQFNIVRLLRSPRGAAVPMSES